MKVIVKNKQANYNYFILDKFEAGIKLQGSEIKSIRLGKVSINDAYVSFKNNEAFIYNMNISKYDQANRFNHDEKRVRKLLLNKKEIHNIYSKIKEEGITVAPIMLYFKNSLVKVEIALARGKKNYDKRADLKDKDVNMRLKKVKKFY